jgi:hypothetical protein
MVGVLLDYCGSIIVVAVRVNSTRVPEKSGEVSVTPDAQSYSTGS